MRLAVDSIFDVLRSHERFRHLRNADAYHRQYLGIWFDGQPLVYVHGVLASSLRGGRDASTGREMSRRLVTLCDGGTSVFGLLYNPATGTLGRLKFGNSDATEYDYEEIIPPLRD